MLGGRGIGGGRGSWAEWGQACAPRHRRGNGSRPPRKCVEPSLPLRQFQQLPNLSLLLVPSLLLFNRSRTSHMRFEEIVRLRLPLPCCDYQIVREVTDGHLKAVRVARPSSLLDRPPRERPILVYVAETERAPQH